MDSLLFLAHRIPYPPNKGDKVRSFHFLKHLASHYRVYLGTFVDDPADWAHVPYLRELCEDVCAVGLAPGWSRLRATGGLASGEALTLPYYRSRPLQRWVDGVVSEGQCARALVFSSAMAQFVDKPRHQSLRRIIDFVDVDSDKWRQYAQKTSFPLRWIYGREARRLLAYERQVARAFDVSTFVCASEAAMFRGLAPQSAARVTHVNNGVDLEYFSAQREYPNPYGEAGPVLVFTGAMDYWANVEAVSWFSKQVFPAVKRSMPDARFFIVGARPVPAVQHLEALPGVTVTGTVKDIRPYLAHAALSVAPLRTARGIQNKVLEAMAMAKPVVATTLAMEGIEPCAALEGLVADEPDEMAGLVVALLDGAEAQRLGEVGRQWVREHYGWDVSLHRLTELLQGPAWDGQGVDVQAGVA